MKKSHSEKRKFCIHINFAQFNLFLNDNFSSLWEEVFNQEAEISNTGIQTKKKISLPKQPRCKKSLPQEG